MHLVFFLYMLFGGVFTITKTALQYSPPLFLVGTRMTLAGILMLAFLYFFQKKHFVYRPGTLLRLLLLSIFSIYLTNSLEFWGLQYLTSFKTCFIYSFSPFFAALLSYFVLSESMTKKKWLGLAIGFAGFLPILLSHGTEEDLTGRFFFLSWAELAVIGAAAASVYGWILLRQLVKEDHYSPLMANGISMAFGGFIALIHSFLVEPWDPIPVTEYIPFIELTILLMIISNLIAYNLYGHLLRHYTATFLSFAGFTTPLFAAFFGWLFLGEQVTEVFYLSAIIVLIGLTLFHQEELKKGYLTDEEKEEEEEPLPPLQKQNIEIS